MKTKKYKTIKFLNYKILKSKNLKCGRMMGYTHKTKKRFPRYIRKFNQIIQNNYKNKKVSMLGLGLGIGMISNLNKNYNIEYVEPEKEIIQIAKNEFNLPKKTKIYQMTARQYLNKNYKTKYDIIFYDIFDKNIKMHWGELNKKYIDKMKSQLKKNGLLIINIISKKQKIKKKLKFLNYEINPQFKNKIFSPISQNYIIKIKK